MAALVGLEAVAIGLLGLLVAGLLRSHAEILRALHSLGVGVGDPAAPAGPARPVDLPFGVAPGLPGPRPVAAAGADDGPTRAVDLTGVSPADDAVAIAVVATAHDSLLAFLSSGCLTCAGFWSTFATERVALPPGTRLVIVTKGPEEESVAAVRALAPTGFPVVMSSSAWSAYQVPVSPYFIHVEGRTGRVLGEGAAGRWEQVAGLLETAVRDRAAADPARPPAPPGAERRLDDRARRQRVDRDLLAAGIGPGDPRLYPTGPLPSGPPTGPGGGGS